MNELPTGIVSGRLRGWAMASVMITVAMVSLDSTIAYTALPAMSADLRASAASTVWVMNAYQLAVVAAVVPLAALGDAIGHRRVMLAGLALFVLAALGCGLAGSLPALIAARAVQGLGAAAVVSVTTALIRFIYPPQRLGHALGLYALVVAISIALGPTVGSLVLTVASWHWLYLLHLPIGAVGIALAWRTIPDTARAAHGYDAAAALLSGGMFASLVFGLTEAAHHAPLAEVAALLAAAVVLGALLMRRQAGHAAPMFAIDLLRNPFTGLSSATSVLSFTTQGLAFVSLPFLFQTVMGFSQLRAGLLLTTWPVVLAVMATIAGRLSDRWPAAILGGAGLVLLALSMSLLALLPSDAAAFDIVWRIALSGMGFGLFQTPNMNAIMSSTPPGRSGGASGIVATSRLLGQALGAALAAACLHVSVERGPAYALWTAGGVAALAAAVSFARTRVAPARAQDGSNATA